MVRQALPDAMTGCVAGSLEEAQAINPISPGSRNVGYGGGNGGRIRSMRANWRTCAAWV